MARFRPGISGNPRGRPTDSIKAARIRQQILKATPEIAERMIEAAKSGDMNAARALLITVVPPMRAVEQTVTLNIPDDDLALQGKAVIQALAHGQLAPGAASQILAGLGALARLIEITEFDRRLSALENQKCS